jgi:hypothetical protein
MVFFDFVVLAFRSTIVDGTVSSTRNLHVPWYGRGTGIVEKKRGCETYPPSSNPRLGSSIPSPCFGKNILGRKIRNLEFEFANS